MTASAPSTVKKVENERHCGFRKIGGIYLVTDSTGYECDALPLPLIPCDDCGYTANFARSLQMIPVGYIKQLSEQEHLLRWSYTRDTPRPECKCPSNCPICHPETVETNKIGLMFVGSKFYSPEEFVDEAKQLGISKRIAEIPRDFEIGKQWILLAHLKVTFHREGRFVESEKHKAVFYAFRPTRVEMPLFSSMASNDLVLALEDRGITPVIIQDTPEMGYSRIGQK